MEKLGLQYFVPGDQDFALGLEFLNEIANTHSYHFLISNLTTPETIKHKEWAKLIGGPHRFYLVGLVDPKTLPLQFSSLFLDVNTGLERTLKLLESDGYDPQNPFHRLIVLSHSGLDPDRALARAYPQINWILGSHSHSFTQVPQKEGDTTIVQVLSRNHYAGELRLSLKQDRTGDQFFMHEVKESLDTVLKPNPISEFINAYKTQLTEMQKEEQKLLFDHDYSNTPMNTANSCLECHSEQAEKWVTTPHSLAYLTLIRANQPYDLSCIQCHSVGAQNERGFMTAEEMVRVDPTSAEGDLSKLETVDLRTNYWTAMREAFKDVGVVKELKPNRIKQLKNQWGELDKRFGVTHNFANVQCLNCHSQHPEHPFNISKTTPLTEAERQLSMQNRCMDCHNQSQSPAWYVKNEQGLPGVLDTAVFEQALKKVACPKSETL
jgi:nitrate/TMAO reductase-like tetraheme cytochrome c subunit